MTLTRFVALLPGTGLIALDLVSIFSSRNGQVSSLFWLDMTLALLACTTFIAFLLLRLFAEYKRYIVIALLITHLLVGLSSYCLVAKLSISPIATFSMGLLMVFGVLVWDSSWSAES